MKNFFVDIYALSEYAPGVVNSTDLATLQPAFLTARQKVAEIITPAILKKVVEDKTAELYKYFQAALANRTMYEYAIFFAVAKSEADKLYKYQYEAIKEVYISNFWAAMNNILQHLDSNTDYADWKDAKHYKERQKLVVKSAEDFDYYYAIESSPYFYYKVQFLIRKITSDEIRPRIKKLEVLKEEGDFAEKIKRALCYHVVAEAVMTFDLTELPKSIRSEVNHEFTKNGSTPQTRDKLYNYLMKQVHAWYRNIETEMLVRKGAVDIEVIQNKEENNHFLIG